MSTGVLGQHEAEQAEVGQLGTVGEVEAGQLGEVHAHHRHLPVRHAGVRQAQGPQLGQAGHRSGEHLLGEFVVGKIEVLQLEAPLGGEQQHEAEVGLAVGQVEAGEVRRDQEVAVVLPQQSAGLQTQPDVVDQVGGKVVKGSKEVHKVDTAIVIIQEVLVPIVIDFTNYAS